MHVTGAFWILLWLDGFCLALLLWSFPETSATNILYRRAARLRKRTGNDKLKSQGEIDGASMGPKEIAMMTLVRPILLTFREPVCFVMLRFRLSDEESVQICFFLHL